MVKVSMDSFVLMYLLHIIRHTLHVPIVFPTGLITQVLSPL